MEISILAIHCYFIITLDFLVIKWYITQNPILRAIKNIGKRIAINALVYTIGRSVTSAIRQSIDIKAVTYPMLD